MLSIVKLNNFVQSYLSFFKLPLSSLQAIFKTQEQYMRRCTPSALWAIRCTPMHYGQRQQFHCKEKRRFSFCKFNTANSLSIPATRNFFPIFSRKPLIFFKADPPKFNANPMSKEVENPPRRKQKAKAKKHKPKTGTEMTNKIWGHS